MRTLLLASMALSQILLASPNTTDPFREVIRRKDVPDLKYCRQQVKGFRDPEICYMTVGAADEYCKLQGRALPTLRQIAARAVRNGAQGILELAAVARLPEGKAPADYLLMETREADGSRDSFYYAAKGFVSSASSGKVEDIYKTLWTSSRLPDGLHYYVLTAAGYLGPAVTIRNPFPTAVVCQ